MLQCITNFDRENGYNTSLQLPDATLNFAKKHPLMEDKALARPLLLTKGVNFTKLAVDRVSALDQRAYNVLFIGTGTNYMKCPIIAKTTLVFSMEKYSFHQSEPNFALLITLLLT